MQFGYGEIVIMLKKIFVLKKREGCELFAGLTLDVIANHYLKTLTCLTVALYILECFMFE